MAEDDRWSQQPTQEVFDPRRAGRNNSGLCDDDISDVICLLYPTTTESVQVVTKTAETAPQHVVFNHNASTSLALDLAVEDQETFILDKTQREQVRGNAPPKAQAIALRFSSRLSDGCLGFVFGRHPLCDIKLAGRTDASKRISNRHFRIYLADSGIVMLEDLSTNGTFVDGVHLGTRTAANRTRMLEHGSNIKLPYEPPDTMDFIVRFPNRDGHEAQYTENLREYLAGVNAEARARYQDLGGAAPPAGPSKLPTMPISQAFRGAIHGKDKQRYNIVGSLGKGAFATVHQVARAIDGNFFAAKELDKARFMKHGQLDQRLDNEMKIMQDLRHPNIVEYVDYGDDKKSLYIFMEYVPHGDLQGFLTANKVLPEPQTKLMADQIFNALDYLHQMNVTHRDIKPDNILISSFDPFTVKLSDFGLSKVVKNNETFLKTFCGTLLYCAPEVFPHYDAHAAGARTKRRKGSNGRKFHSYSQSVDIWSFGAVLWFTLCGSPPFEGIAEPAGGRGMFDRIMGTPLDPTPLRERKISESAIDLLCSMLNTDPAQRPTEKECLAHPWLNNGDVLAGKGTMSAESGMSQLSLQSFRKPDGLSVIQERSSESVQWDSDDFGFFDPRESKRIRHDEDEAIGRPTGHEMAVALNSEGALPPDPNVTAGQPGAAAAAAARLFGEIGHSALQSSGVLDDHTNVALDLPPSASPNQDPTSSATIEQPPALNNPSNSAHVSEAEAGMRDLEMESPQSANSPAGPSNEPQTPASASLDGTSGSQEDTPKLGQPKGSQAESTPKAAAFNRRISLLPENALFESYESNQADPISLPSTVTGSQLAAMNSNDEPSTDLNHGLGPENPIAVRHNQAQFARPLPVLGTLTTTPDSFTSITLRLQNRVNTWGRGKCTFIWPYEQDTRIPKMAFAIFFDAPNASTAEIEQEGGDWTKTPGLYAGITTNARAGILVNNVRLKPRTDDGKHHVYGKLRTGDVITVYRGDANASYSGSDETAERLSFVCKFHSGDATEPRESDAPFELIRAGIDV
jgi:serine/threonine protein kinase